MSQLVMTRAEVEQLLNTSLEQFKQSLMKDLLAALGTGLTPETRPSADSGSPGGTGEDHERTADAEAPPTFTGASPGASNSTPDSSPPDASSETPSDSGSSTHDDSSETNADGGAHDAPMDTPSDGPTLGAPEPRFEGSLPRSPPPPRSEDERRLRAHLSSRTPTIKAPPAARPAHLEEKSMPLEDINEIFARLSVETRPLTSAPFSMAPQPDVAPAGDDPWASWKSRRQTRGGSTDSWTSWSFESSWDASVSNRSWTSSGSRGWAGRSRW